MKFIERLFGKKQEKEESHPIVFDLKDISATVKEEMKKQENELKPVVKERYDHIRQALKELDTLKKELLDARPIENASKRGEKLGDSNRDNVVNNLNLIDEKVKVPGNTSPLTASEFYNDAKSILKTVLDNTNRSLLYIKALYPQEHQKINQGLAELEDSIDELYASIIQGNKKISELDKIIAQIDDVQRIGQEIKESTEKMTDLDSRYEDAKKKLSEETARKVELDKSKEFERAKQLENEIRTITKKLTDAEAEARRLFTPLSKAISRVEKQDENKRCVLSADNRHILKSIKSNPAAAIERNIEPFLSELTSRIESGELGLKDQMCDKALKQIQILSDKKIISSLVKQREEYLSAKEELTTELNSLSVYQKKEKIERELEAQQSHASSVNSDMDMERRHLDSLEEEMERARTVLLSSVRNVFGSDVTIEYEIQNEN